MAGNNNNKALIVGGAGFVGSNIADKLLSSGQEVIIYDDLSRKGVTHNLEWLKERHGKRVEYIKGDISRPIDVKATGDIDRVYHLAAQVAVTTSMELPVRDFEVNALGTLNVLEFARKLKSDPVVIYTSTNKVYGGLASVPVDGKKTRYEYKLLENGIDEKMPLSPCTPYGCSKAVGDVYVQDYYKSYGLKTVTFRMSCIYGPRQFGTVDQGWIAHIITSVLLKRPITVYGDGKQVRDILFITDLANAFALATEKIGVAKGKVYNMGGGPKNTTSVLELISFLEKVRKGKIGFAFSDWRPSDQKAFYCDTRLAKRDLGWQPAVKKEDGIRMLHDWIAGNQALFQ